MSEKPPSQATWSVRGRPWRGLPTAVVHGGLAAQPRVRVWLRQRCSPTARHSLTLSCLCPSLCSSQHGARVSSVQVALRQLDRLLLLLVRATQRHMRARSVGALCSAVPSNPERICMCKHRCFIFLTFAISVCLLLNLFSSFFFFFFFFQHRGQPDEPNHLPEPEAGPEHPLLVHRRRPVLLRAVVRGGSHAPCDAHVHPPCRAMLGQCRRHQEWAMRRGGG